MQATSELRLLLYALLVPEARPRRSAGLQAAARGLMALMQPRVLETPVHEALDCQSLLVWPLAFVCLWAQRTRSSCTHQEADRTAGDVAQPLPEADQQVRSCTADI